MKRFLRRTTNRYEWQSSVESWKQRSGQPRPVGAFILRHALASPRFMKLDRARYEPGELLEFYEHGLAELGALCERTWHDRLEIIAEGRAAKLWNPDGKLHEVELHFASADATVARDAAREVFPGCPLTFELAEMLRSSPLSLERFVLPHAAPHPPDAAVAEKLWRLEFPETRRWQLASPFEPDFHFTLLALARCEIQAIDQHWSLHRLALSLPGGEPDDLLARDVNFQHNFQQAGSQAQIAWPAPDPASWRLLLHRALERELADDLAQVRARQDHSLRRELERIDGYFENYERELHARSLRTASSRVANEKSRLKTADRLAAAKAEHTRRRADQLARHEIRVQPHVDALLLLAESAWHARLQMDSTRDSGMVQARFVPRLRRWMIEEPKN